jgi:hypothetical protein
LFGGVVLIGLDNFKDLGLLIFVGRDVGVDETLVVLLAIDVVV